MKSLDNKLVMDILKNEVDNLRNYLRDNVEDNEFAGTLFLFLMQLLIGAIIN